MVKQIIDQEELDGLVESGPRPSVDIDNFVYRFCDDRMWDEKKLKEEESSYTRDKIERLGYMRTIATETASQTIILQHGMQMILEKLDKIINQLENKSI
tara:strand:+ start:516 stop:812 length:297 start_codon:yes stop_codon:yes gene_type:complete